MAELESSSDKPTTDGDQSGVVDYASPDIDAVPEIPLARLIWLSLPPFAGAILFATWMHLIRANPLDETAGENVFFVLALVALVSLITSGATILALFESRKTIVNVSFLAIHLGWFIAGFAYFIFRRIQLLP